MAGCWKVFYIENQWFALDTLGVANRSPPDRQMEGKGRHVESNALQLVAVILALRLAFLSGFSAELLLRRFSRIGPETAKV